METILQQLVSGSLHAMFLFLLASGLSLVLGVTRVLNLGHGALYMVGAYAYLVLFPLMPQNFWGFLLVVVLSTIIAGLVGGLFEVAILRRIYASGILYHLLVTFGFLLLVEQLVKIIWGARLLSAPRPENFHNSISLGNISLPTYNLVILFTGLLLGLLLWFIVYRTRWGRLTRAAAMDREMLNALGINVTRLYTQTFVFGSLLAGAAGALVAPLVALSPNMAAEVLIEIFAVIVIGGLGSLAGSLLSSMLIGHTEAIAILVVPGAGLPLIFALMAIILIVRPQGILGKKHV